VKILSNCKCACEEAQRSALKCVSLRHGFKIVFRKGLVYSVDVVVASGLPALLALSALVGLVVVRVALDCFGS
jgi:hypothetical protein